MGILAFRNSVLNVTSCPANAGYPRLNRKRRKTWMAGTSPAMTVLVVIEERYSLVASLITFASASPCMRWMSS
jgi:hypothetical protein